ncbi:MAG: hypothetical protein J3Q66DRAFT_402380 [Benniella sp.]|nr:MAG: hypothetical protein J3Q66DRAFT_402380 [Benniella sp.]
MLDIPGLNTLLARSKRLHHSQLLLTVFDHPELNHIIFSYLSKDDLLKWARVSRKWHHAVIPYIWNDLSTLSDSQYRCLTRVIVEDYQRVHCDPQKAEGTQQSSLAKYCPSIRKLGRVSEKILGPSFLFDFILRDSRLPSNDKETVAQKIFHHFMMHCTNLLTLDYELSDLDLHGPVDVIANTGVQHLQHLSIKGKILDRTFKYIMSQCSTKLETLELDFNIFVSDRHCSAMEVDETRQKPLSVLRRLSLGLNRTCYHEGSLSFLWKRCESVEALDLVRCDIGFFQLMPTVIGSFLPNINAIRIRQGNSGYELEDDDLARLLSGSRSGWISVDIEGYLNFGERSWEELSQHTSTLQNVKLHHQKGVEPIQILSLFPNLQTFVTLGINSLKVKPIDAIEWIHQGPMAGSLTPWPCEYTLTDLRIKISGIPRPDVTHDHRGEIRQPAVNESYHGEGRKIQQQVYERLSRFVNLEILWLGSNSFYCQETFRGPKAVLDRQYECLAMSLESGLDRLEGLKRLRVLNVSLMATKIGQKEAQWMAWQWPRLREVHGIGNQGDARKARRWFNRNCRLITTPPLSVHTEEMVT